MNDVRIRVIQKRLVSDSQKLVDDARLLESSAQKILESALPSTGPRKVPPPFPKKEPVEEGEIEEATPEVVEKVVQEAALETEIEKEFESVFEVITEESEPPEIALSHNGSVFAKHCRDLFAECQSNYEMLKAFDEELKGTEVDETALFKRAESFSMDRVFGRGPGIRRFFPLGSLENGDQLMLVTNSPVDLTIREAKEKEGNADSIQGNFVAFDPFSRTLFVKVPQLDKDHA